MDPAGLRAGHKEIIPTARVLLYLLTALLVVSAVDGGWTTAGFLWLSLWLLTLALRDIENLETPGVWRAIAVVPSAGLLVAADVAIAEGTRTSRGLITLALVAAALVVLRAAYPAGVDDDDWVLLLGAAAQLGWLDWQAATIGLLAIFGSFGLFTAALLLRDRPLAHEAVPISPFVYLGVLTGIALA